MLVPTFDLIRVALNRIRRGVSIFHPDKTHIHHKLMLAGKSMRSTLGVILLLAIFFIVLNNLLYALQVNINLIVVIDILLYTLFHLVLNFFISKRKAVSK